MNALPMILLVDTNTQRLKQNQQLASRYFQTAIASDYAEAFSQIKQFAFHVAIIDKSLGNDVFSLCVRSNAHLWVMAAGESWTESEVQQLESIGVRREDIFQYPFEIEDFPEIAQALGFTASSQPVPLQETVLSGPYAELSATTHEEPPYAPSVQGGYETPPIPYTAAQPQMNRAPQQAYVQGPYTPQSRMPQQVPTMEQPVRTQPMQNPYPNQQMPMGYGVQQGMIPNNQTQMNTVMTMNSMNNVHKGVYAIYSPKGGVGKTTVSVNMALALARAQVSVCLVDLDVFYGNVATLLNLTKNKPLKTVLNWVDTPKEMDQKTVMDNLMKHESGLWVLPAPRRAIEEDYVTAEVAEKVITYLRHYFDIVLIDLGPSFKDPTVVTFQLCDKILLVSELDLMTISDCNDMATEFKGMAIPIPKVEVIFNHVSGSEGISMKEATQLLSQYTISGQLPEDSKVKWSTNKQGVPAIIGAPKAPFSKAITEMTHRLFALQGMTQEKKKGSLFSFFNRNKGGLSFK